MQIFPCISEGVGIWYWYIRDFPATFARRVISGKEADKRLFYRFVVPTVKRVHFLVETLTPLASADVVKGRHVTSYWHDGMPEDLKKAGALWEDKDVVVDGNLVTAR